MQNENASQNPALPIKACLFGPFALCDAAGTDLAPASAKARATIAMAVVAPDQTRARSFLAETLWSDRARPQALGSLRQVLSEIRASLGACADVLEIDRKAIRFRAGTVVSDVADAADHVARGARFLEDVELGDPGFQRWKETACQVFGLSWRSRNDPILHVQTSGNASPVMQRMLGHGIVDSIADWCAARIATTSNEDTRFGPEFSENISEYLLESHLHQFENNGISAHLALYNNSEGRSAWAMGAALPGMNEHPFHDAQALHLINVAVDRSIHSIAPPGAETATARYLAAGALGAARLVFRNEPGDIGKALAQLLRNFDIQPAGIYLAWSAYITTLQQAESTPADRQALVDQAADYAHRAVELDPYGAMTLALCSYVQSFVLGRTDIGHDLANRSLAINRANPLAWAFRGATQFFHGDGESARRDTEFAQAIAADGPYRYVIDTFCCVASTVAGRFDEAVRYGEAAARQAPRYRAPLRYLAAIHARRGDHAALRQVVRKLRELEPAFTIESLEQTAYPVPSLRAAGLICGAQVRPSKR